MKISFSKFTILAKKNMEIFLLIFTLILLATVTQIYNYTKDVKKKNFYSIIENLYFKKTLNYYMDNLNPKYINISHKISSGETLAKILKRYEVSDNEINRLQKELSKKNNLNTLKLGLKIDFVINTSDKKITKFSFPISSKKKIHLVRDLENDTFSTNEIVKNLNKQIIFKEGRISQSLYKSASALGIKPNIIVEFARIYGFEVDFQRDIRKNDSYQIVYEILQDDNGKIFETGNILYANLILRGQTNPLYYFNKKKHEGHYDLSGKSIQKALMKSPINGARLSSSFGMRKHPISGFNKMHKGTDFAAPIGTPIMASGNGIVTRAQWCGGGGNCVKIKHNSTYQTIYAHMSKFGRGIKSGVRVKQGQIIGYVGSTGISTGPHLHYEVVVNNKKINSQTLKLPSGKILIGENRKLFEINRIKTDVLISELIMNQG